MKKQIIIITRSPNYADKEVYKKYVPQLGRNDELRPENNKYLPENLALSIFQSRYLQACIPIKKYLNSGEQGSSISTKMIAEFNVATKVKFRDVKNNLVLLSAFDFATIAEPIKIDTHKVEFAERPKVYINFPHPDDPDAEIVMVLWDYAVEELGKPVNLYGVDLIEAICKDCMNENTKGESILYIHDIEWGVTSLNSVILDAKRSFDDFEFCYVHYSIDSEKKRAYDRLRSYFKYAISFIHKEYYFENIVNLTFEKYTIADKYRDVEAVVSSGSFIDAIKKL